MDITKYHGQFQGTARYYAKYRPEYPTVLFEYLWNKFDLDGTGRLMDLGCGTGHIAIPMAKYFEEVVAIDPEQEMLEEAKTQAEHLGIKNIYWILSNSDELNSDLGKFRLVTMGRSFNWMDRDNTLKVLYKMIIPTGGIAVVSERDWVWNIKYEWQSVVQEVIKRWISKIERGSPKERHEEVIARSDFKNMEIYTYDYKRLWTIDKIIGYLYSTSYCRTSVLGEKKKAFEQDLRQALTKLQQKYNVKEFIEDVTLQVITALKQ